MYTILIFWVFFKNFFFKKKKEKKEKETTRSTQPDPIRLLNGLGWVDIFVELGCVEILSIRHDRVGLG